MKAECLFRLSLCLAEVVLNAKRASEGLNHMDLSPVICPSAHSCISSVCFSGSEDVLKTRDEITGVRAELQLRTLPFSGSKPQSQILTGLK